VSRPAEATLVTKFEVETGRRKGQRQPAVMAQTVQYQVRSGWRWWESPGLEREGG